MFGLGVTELIVIAAIIMLLFGPGLVRRFFKSATATAKELKSLRAEIEAGNDESIETQAGRATGQPERGGQ
jgi:Sec-independent protein translocase protein TatA